MVARDVVTAGCASVRRFCVYFTGEALACLQPAGWLSETPLRILSLMLSGSHSSGLLRDSTSWLEALHFSPRWVNGWPALNSGEFELRFCIMSSLALAAAKMSVTRSIAYSAYRRF